MRAAVKAGKANVRAERSASAEYDVRNAPEFHRDKHLGDAGYREELGTYYGIGGPFGGRPA
ncbi:hypothetical protein ACVWXB_000906 [Streptomyces sp. TE12347]